MTAHVRQLTSHKACGSGPCVKLTVGTAVLQVLDALVEVAFEPKMEAARLEKERKAVLAEAQMMNTIEYRSVMPSQQVDPRSSTGALTSSEWSPHRWCPGNVVA